MMFCTLATPDDHPADILSRVASIVEMVGDYADRMSTSPPGADPDKRSMEGLALVCGLIREAMAQAVANQRQRELARPFEHGLNDSAQNAAFR